jgi:hypothetical protein
MREKSQQKAGKPAKMILIRWMFKARDGGNLSLQLGTVPKSAVPHTLTEQSFLVR